MKSAWYYFEHEAKEKKNWEIIFQYRRALKSKVWLAVDEKIWILEIMKEYWLSYSQIVDETPEEIYDLMKAKLIEEREFLKKQK